jgi:hypothetical protein
LGERYGKVVGGNLHALGKIEAMRRETLHPRIEFETLAARFPRAVE